MVHLPTVATPELFPHHTAHSSHPRDSDAAMVSFCKALGNEKHAPSRDTDYGLVINTNQIRAALLACGSVYSTQNDALQRVEGQAG